MICIAVHSFIHSFIYLLSQLVQVGTQIWCKARYIHYIHYTIQVIHNLSKNPHSSPMHTVTLKPNAFLLLIFCLTMLTILFSGLVMCSCMFHVGTLFVHCTRCSVVSSSVFQMLHFKLSLNSPL